MGLNPSTQSDRKMDYKLKISKEAHQDLQDIVSYISNELVSPIAAANFLDELEKGYHAVIENPLMYALCNDDRLRKEGYRKFLVKNYIVFYRIDASAEVVYIVRVIYGRRDYGKLI